MFIREPMARGEAPADIDVDSASLAVALLLHGAWRIRRSAAPPGIRRPWSVPSPRSSPGRWQAPLAGRARRRADPRHCGVGPVTTPASDTTKEHWAWDFPPPGHSLDE